MSWYRAGTVTVTNGSSVVNGAGTDFVQNVAAGEAFLAPDGRVYEVSQVISATDLRLSGVYVSGTAAGQGYAIVPTHSFVRDLALGAAELLNSFATVRDGIGAGLIADGTQAAPGIRFAVDQDTGLRRSDINALALVAGGRDRFTVRGDGTIIALTDPLGDLFNLRFSPGTADAGADTSKGRLGLFYGDGTESCAIDFRRGGGSDDGRISMRTSNVERARVDQDGNFLIGVAAGTSHHIGRLIGQGEPVLTISNAGYGFVSAVFQSVGGTMLGSAVECAISAGTNPSTGRSINAGGTINASGADYAEYMTKADGCGTIEKGDVCGVDGDGRLTRTWADAHSFVVKSSDPAYVGGDVWGTAVGPRPDAPADDDAQAKAAYDDALAVWGDALEAARQTVDRIAFAGQVPVNIAGDFEVGDYLIAAANGGGIKATAVPAGDITFAQYQRRLGKVWAVRDGRAWVDVQHG